MLSLEVMRRKDGREGQDWMVAVGWGESEVPGDGKWKAEDAACFPSISRPNRDRPFTVTLYEGLWYDSGFS